MKPYVVRYSPRAIDDLQSAYDWAVENWGRDDASKWAAKFATHLAERLSFSPIACSVAPESAGRSIEIRQLVIHRYRVLFPMEDTTVYILRVRGSFSGQDLEIDRTDAA